MKTEWVLAGGAAALWLLGRPETPAAQTERLRASYAARVAAGDPQAGTNTLTALLGWALKVGLGPAATAIRKLLATGSEPIARQAVTDYLQAPSPETLEQIAADLDVTAGLDLGAGAEGESLPPWTDAEIGQVEASLQALDTIQAYDTESLDAASRGLDAALTGQIETGWTGADIEAAQALVLGTGEVPADVAAGLELAYGPITAVPADVAAGLEVAYGGGLSAEGFLTTLGPALRIAGIIGAAASIGFTIASDKPDLQKGVDSALDAASIAALWIPVYGWAVAAGAQAVKFILGFTGIWEGGESHEVREAREAARYAGQFQTFTNEIQSERTWMGLFNRFGTWASGYVGGTSAAAVSVNVAGVREWIEPGRMVPQRDGPVSVGYFGGRPNPYYPMATAAGGFVAILSNLNNLSVTVQAGISESTKAQMNAAIRGAIIVAMRGLIESRATDFPHFATAAEIEAARMAEVAAAATGA